MAGTDGTDEFFSGTVKLRPPGLEAARSRMDRFVASATERSKRVVLITSGGTTVPLETNTVRFIDNFSTGTRGARCAEEFVTAGYAVILLYRKGSNFPFLTSMVRQLSEDPLSLVAAGKGQGGPGDGSPQELADSLLPVSFVTIFEYLFLLREASCSLHAAGATVMLVLAAAVADFYVPESEMATQKIQSRSKEGLSLHLRNVPKLLGFLKQWAPRALVISFKLETNQNILMAKAAGSISTYGVDAVCSNLLQSYRDTVTIVWRDSHSSGVRIAAVQINGDEDEPVPVEGLQSQRIERGNHSSIETPLVWSLVSMHGDHIERCNRAPAALLEEGPEPKRKRTAI